MKTQVTFLGRRTPQCNKCNKKTSIILMEAITFMNKNFSTKKTKATFFCQEHQGKFSIMDNKGLFYYL